MNRFPYIGAPGAGGEPVGLVKPFAVDPGPKWAECNGATLADVAAYPALVKAHGVNPIARAVAPGSAGAPAALPEMAPYYADAEGRYAVDPGAAGGIVYLSKDPTGAAFASARRSTDGGMTWPSIAPAPTFPLGALAADTTIRRLAVACSPTLWAVIHERDSYVDFGGGEFQRTVSFAVHTSANQGAAWTARALPGFTTSRQGNQEGDDTGNFGFAGIAWSASLGRFVIATRPGQIYSSPDGINWTERVAAGSALAGVRWFPAAGVFLAWNSSGQVRRSVDGLTWSALANAATTGADNFGYPVYLEQRGPVAGPGSRIVYGRRFSTDGGQAWSTWAHPTVGQLGAGIPAAFGVASGAGAAIYDPAFTADMALIRLYASGNPAGQHYTSTDLVNWTRAPIFDVADQPFSINSGYAFGLAGRFYGTANGSLSTAYVRTPAITLPLYPQSPKGRFFMRIKD